MLQLTLTRTERDTIEQQEEASQENVLGELLADVDAWLWDSGKTITIPLDRGDIKAIGCMLEDEYSSVYELPNKLICKLEALVDAL